MTLATLARPLAIFSIALGLVELAMPRRIANAHSAASAEPLVKAYGVREIAAGLGILAAPRSPWGLVARAAGDVLDIGAAGAAASNGQGRARAVAFGSLAFATGALALDLAVARALARG